MLSPVQNETTSPCPGSADVLGVTVPLDEDDGDTASDGEDDAGAVGAVAAVLALLPDEQPAATRTTAPAATVTFATLRRRPNTRALLGNCCVTDLMARAALM